MVSYVTPVFGSLSGILGLLFLALSFATDNWLEFTVDRVELEKSLKTADPATQDLFNKHPTMFSRHFGLFRTCFLGKDAAFLDHKEFSSRVVDNICLWESGYQLGGRDPSTLRYGEQYERRTHLMRAHFGLHAAAIVLLVIAMISTACSCIRSSDKWLQYSGLAILFAGVLAAGGMGCFHGYNYLEVYALKYPDFRAHYLNNAPLQGYTLWTYGWSYIVGWIGVALTLIASALFMASANQFSQQIRRLEREERRMEAQGKANKAYEAYNTAPSVMAAYPSYDYPTMGGPGMGNAIIYDPTMMMDYSKQPLAIEYPYAASVKY